MSPLPIVLICAAALALAWWIWSQPWRQRRRRARLAGQPFPAAWRAILRRRVPLYRRLPADLQRQLRALIQAFIAEKAFIGCAGQAIDDEVRVTIAAQACLLQLNRRSADLFANCRQVLVYPAAFIVERAEGLGAGLVSEQRRVLLGESWSRGQIILSWPDCLAGAADPDDGHNVVIHEFAHQLDQLTGSANGAPPLPSRARHARWSAVMNREFAELRKRAALGQPALLDAYAATEPAEFFAVASEVFFERPGPLAAEHPMLYDELAAYFRVDPLNW
ncbi:zinc-dependent peptidase [Piscinibacter sakaiensis]|uniref:M90 family metallopeptidase n=1 Tax=Piscinibacter sakaiensis TaxID=1547922 RepID=UPI003AAB4646